MTATFPFAKPVCGCLAKRDGSIDMVSEANRINGNHGAGHPIGSGMPGSAAAGLQAVIAARL